MRRTITVPAFVVAGLLLLATAASAAAPGWYSAPDPVADGRVYRANDITGIRIGNRPSVELHLTTRFGANPWAHPAWQDPEGDTRIVWSLDTDEDAGPEYQVRLVSAAGGPDVARVVELGNGSYTCAANVVQDGNRYLISFNWTCIGAPGRLQARVRYQLDPPNGEARTDAAPNGGRYTPPVVYPIPI